MLKSMKISTLFCCLMMLLFYSSQLFAQQPDKMSSDVVEYNGKFYYLHVVEKKQTIKDIASIYAVSEKEILRENKDVKDKLRVGQVIRVPVTKTQQTNDAANNTEQVQKIENQYNINSFYSDECGYVTPNPDAVYRVALMMPLCLEQIDNEFVRARPNNKMLLSKPFSFLQFYEGFMIAVDSLVASRGLKLDLKVYDIDQNIAKVDSAMNDIWLQQADLIIGPFHLKSFEKMSDFASQHNIMIVNPITNKSSIVDNHSNVVKVKPSYQAQIERLGNLIHTQYPNNKVFIFRENQGEDSIISALAKQSVSENINPSVTISNQYIVNVINTHHRKWKNNKIEFSADFFDAENRHLDVKYLKEHLDDSTTFENSPTVYVYSVDSLRRMRAKASVIRNNVVIVIGDDKVFATEIINKVNMLADDFPITLIALPEWSKFDRLFNENLMKMNTIYFDDEFVDYQDVGVMYFICEFRDRYGSEPKDIAYQGFDIGWYFLNALMRYGTEIKSCLSAYKIPLLHTEFDFRRNNADNGLENQFWNVYQFKNYEKVILPLD